MIVQGGLIVNSGQSLNLNGSNVVISGNLSLSDSLVTLYSSNVVVDGASSLLLGPAFHLSLTLHTIPTPFSLLVLGLD